MRALTTGLLVIVLVFVCTQAIGLEKTLEEWGVPPISWWVFRSSKYLDVDNDGYEETVQEIYYAHGAYVYVSRLKDMSQCYSVAVITSEGLIRIYEDYNYDGLWTLESEKFL